MYKFLQKFICPIFSAFLYSWVWVVIHNDINMFSYYMINLQVSSMKQTHFCCQKRKFESDSFDFETHYLSNRPASHPNLITHLPVVHTCTLSHSQLHNWYKVLCEYSFGFILTLFQQDSIVWVWVPVAAELKGVLTVAWVLMFGGVTVSPPCSPLICYCWGYITSDNW